MNFLPGFLSVIFNKEYIVANDELIIYLTFLTLLITIVNLSHKFLNETFNSIKNYEQLNLTTSSKTQQVLLQNLITTAELFSYNSADIENNLPEISHK